MTTIRLGVLHPTGTATDARSTGSVEWVPSARRVVGTDVVLPDAFRVTLTADADVTVDVAPTTTAWVWKVLERVKGGSGGWRYLAVPDSAEVVDYAALVEVDPATLDPVAVPEAAWWAAAGGMTAELALKAPSASPAFTGTPTGITKTHVGLGSVDNTADADKPVSIAQAAAAAAAVAAALQKPPPDLMSQILYRASATARLHNFQTNITSLTGTVTYDTGIFFSGTRSLKIVTNTGTNVGSARVDLGAATLNLSDAYLAIMAYRPSSSPALSEVRFQLWGAAFTNLGYWRVSYAGATCSSTDRWELVTPTNSTATAVSALVRYIDISITSGTAGVAASMYFNELRSVPNRTTGAVTFTLDGAYVGQYTQLKPLLDAKGFRACVMTNFAAGAATPGGSYMTLPQLAACEATGWDVSTHSGDLMTGKTAAELTTVAQDRQTWLRDNGFSLSRGGRFWVNLQNSWDKQSQETLRQHFWFLRTGNAYTTSGIADGQPSLPVFNPAGIIDSASNTTYAQQADKLQRAATHKQWTVLTWHEPGKVGELTLAEMSTIIDLVVSLGLQVVTLSDVMDSILFH